MTDFTVAVLVKNEPGVLNRVTSMFRRRRFNIKSLTVSETESNLYSRITVTSNGEEHEKRQLIDQLYKLPDVSFIKELYMDDSVSCELLLVKMAIDGCCDNFIYSIAREYDAKAVNVTADSVILRLTGATETIDSFINSLKQFKILELCRTGIVSLEIGSDTIRKEE